MEIGIVSHNPERISRGKEGKRIAPRQRRMSKAVSDSGIGRRGKPLLSTKGAVQRALEPRLCVFAMCRPSLVVVADCIRKSSSANNVKTGRV